MRASACQDAISSRYETRSRCAMSSRKAVLYARAMLRLTNAASATASSSVATTPIAKYVFSEPRTFSFTSSRSGIDLAQLLNLLELAAIEIAPRRVQVTQRPQVARFVFQCLRDLRVETEIETRLECAIHEVERRDQRRERCHDDCEQQQGRDAPIGHERCRDGVHLCHAEGF